MGQRDLTLPLDPLNSQQRAYWALHQRDGKWGHFDMFAFRVTGPLSLSAVKRSAEELLRRHDALRTKVTLFDGIPVQYVDTITRCRLEIIREISSLTDNSADHFEARILEILESLDRQEPDLTHKPLFTIHFFPLSGEQCVLAWLIHHLIFDMQSLSLLFKEFWALYAEALAGSLPFLRNESPQYSDYRSWQRKPSPFELQRHAHHVALLDGAAGLAWPYTEQYTDVMRGAVECAAISFPDVLADGLRRVARQTPTLLSLVMFTIYIDVVSRWCAQQDFIVATMVTGRYRPEHEQVIGLLSYPACLRIRLNGKETPVQLLHKVAQEFYRAMLYTDFGKTVAENPELLSGSVFNWFPWRVEDVFGILNAAESAKIGLKVEHFPFNKRTTFPQHLNIELALLDTPDIRGFIAYRLDRFDRRTVDRLIHELQLAAMRMIEDSNSRATAQQV